MASGKVARLLGTGDVVNNLTSTATDKPLSAAQGKALNDKITKKIKKVDITTNQYGWIFFPDNEIIISAGLGTADTFIPIYSDVDDQKTIARGYFSIDGTFTQFTANTQYSIQYTYL